MGRTSGSVITRLLRDLLAHRLELEQPGVTEQLHLRAAQWYAAQGEPIPAIRHATLAGDWDDVGRLLITTALPLLLSPAGPALAAALQPAAVRATQERTLARCSLRPRGTSTATIFASMHADQDRVHVPEVPASRQ